MFDLVDFVLRFSYYYARLMGVLNFEIDLQSGRSSISHKATIYAVLVNVFIFCFLPLQLLRSDNINVAWAQANRLHVQVFVIMTKIRLVGVLLSLLSRWRQRHELRCLLRGFRQLFLTKPQVKKLYRRGVISKCIFDTLAELFQMFVELDAQRQPFSLELCLNLSLMYFLTALLNSIVAQYFFGMLHVHAHYMLLNLELSRLLSEIRSINKVNARRHNVGIFMSKCCALADQLDEIAVTQSKLQRLVEQMSKIFGLQSFCIFSTYYLSSVATIYFTFCAFKYSASGLGTSPFGLVMISSAIICYYIDNLLVIFAHLYTLDAHDKMLKLMEERCLYPAGLDQRLETAFESFQLQLARNPLKITVLGLFDLNRCCVITMIASLLSNTIILIQYDIKNY